jgi:hypothetical protein
VAAAVAVVVAVVVDVVEVVAVDGGLAIKSLVSSRKLDENSLKSFDAAVTRSPPYH